MKITKSFCVRCGKLFDFDLYSGLCPHCGCFHRSPGKTNNAKTIVRPTKDSVQAKVNEHLKEDAKKGVKHDQHKTSANVKTTATPVKVVTNTKTATKTTTSNYNTSTSPKVNVTKTYNRKVDVSKRNNTLRIIIIVFFALSIISTVLESIDIKDLMYQMEYFFEDITGDTAAVKKADSEIDDFFFDAEPGEEISGGDYTYTVYEAYKLGTAEEIAEYVHDFALPEGKMLVAVDLSMVYTGKSVEDPGMYYMPMLYSDGEYSGFIDPEEVYSVATEMGIAEYSIWPDYIYANPSDECIEGYLYYIVNDTCDDVTVALELFDGNEMQAMCNVTVPLEEVE